MKRRHFLIGSSAALSAASASASTLSIFDRVLEEASPAIIIADTRIQESQSFIEQLNALNQAGEHPVYTFEGDLTPLWTKHLAPLMKDSAPTILGHTSSAALHCLVPLAAGMGYFLESRTTSDDTSTAWVLRPTRKTRLNSNA